MNRETEIIKSLSRVVATIPVAAGTDQVVQMWQNSVPAAYAQTERCYTEISGRATNSAGASAQVTFEVTAEGKTVPVATDRDGIGRASFEGPSDTKDSTGRDAKRVTIHFPLTSGKQDSTVTCGHRLDVNLSVPDATATRISSRTPTRATPPSTPSPDKKPTETQKPNLTETSSPTKTLKPIETPAPTTVPERHPGDDDPRNIPILGWILRNTEGKISDVLKELHDSTPIIGWVGDFAPARWYVVITSIGLILRPTRVWTRNNLVYGPPRWIFHGIRDGINWLRNRNNPPGGPAAPGGVGPAPAGPAAPAAPVPPPHPVIGPGAAHPPAGGAPAGPVP